MSLESLSEYVFLLICFELHVADILSLQRVCRVFGAATRTRLLWMTLLKTAIYNEDAVLPLYLKNHDSLDAAALEALVLRVSRLARKWRTKDICPVNVWRLHLCQSITWLRLVSGSWLFVASSNNEVSKISCWDLSLLFQGYTEPIAEAYLSGHVKTAQLELQATGVVLALGLGSNTPSVQILTLRQHAGAHYFAELRCIEGSSHVLTLQGNLVGCALRDETVIPHIIDWVANTTYNLPPPPGGLDVPQRRSSPHLIVPWKNFFVVVRQNVLELYAQTVSTDNLNYLGSVETSPIWEVVVLDGLSSSLLRLLVISPLGLELLALEFDLVLHRPVCSRELLAESPIQWDPRWDNDLPWYHLRISGAGRRALWLSVGDITSPLASYPLVMSMAITSRRSNEKTSVLRWTNDLPHNPALWAFPALDFDEALGFTVIGNCFGELAIYDHVGSDPIHCCGLGTDFTEQLSPLVRFLPQHPISLGLRLTPKPPFGQTEPDQSLISHWSQDNLGLNRRIWRIDWFSGMYFNWDMWQGHQGDLVWWMDHAYGFPCTIVPQAYAIDPYSSNVAVVLRAGHRYLLHTVNGPREVSSFPLGPLPRNLRPSYVYGEEQPCMCPTAHTVRGVYQGMFTSEFHQQEGRNRWIELRERGGSPHKNLVDTLSIDPLGA